MNIFTKVELGITFLAKAGNNWQLIMNNYSLLPLVFCLLPFASCLLTTTIPNAGYKGINSGKLRMVCSSVRISPSRAGEK